MKLKPYTIDAKFAHKNKIVSFIQDGSAILNRKGDTKRKIPPSKQFDLTQATIFGLNERLTSSSTSPVMDKSGKTLRDKFNAEWSKYAQALENSVSGMIDYGTYAYYEDRNELVKFCSKYWHRIVSVASNSKLISDAQQKLTWREIRKTFEDTVIGVAGCSVGNNIIHTALMDIRPNSIKISDKSLFKMENVNRVRLQYSDIVKPNSFRENASDTLLRNKSDATARQIYYIDPYINIHLYDEGLGEKNVKRFILGKGKQEPKCDILVEEVDDPSIKILLRQKAREFRIPLIMLTDIGSSVQLDVLRYDKDQSLPLSYNTDDKKLLDAMQAVYDNPGNHEVFFEFVDTLIGKDYRQGELNKIIELKDEIPTSTIIPQLGSTTAMAGAIAAETIARIRLGYDYPKRALFNKKTFETKIYR